ncbi:histidine kinase [bacterium SCSIO 12741]|nr:histidine kinase [bacterium SCSIO 12741]
MRLVFDGVKSVCLYVFLFLLPIQSFGQNPAHWKLTTEHGLPAMTVYDVMQDHSGMIWFGTEHGLCKYDGIQFQSITSNGPFNRDVSYIKQDSLGRIWCRNFSGAVFQVQDDQLKWIKPVYQGEYVEIKDFTFKSDSIFYLNSTKLYGASLGNETQLKLVYDLVGRGRFYYFPIRDSSDQIVVSGLEKKKSANSNKSLIWAPNFNVGSSIQKDQFFLWHQVPLKKFGLFNTDLEYQELNLANYDQPIAATHVSYGPDGLLYITSKNGLFQCDIVGDSLVVRNHYFQDVFLSNLLFDRENNLWLTTLRNGVFVVPDIGLTHWNAFSPVGMQRVTLLKPLETGILIGGNNGKIVHLNQNSVQSYLAEGVEDVRDLELDQNKNLLYAIENGVSIFQFGDSTHIPHEVPHLILKDISLYGEKTLFASAMGAYLFADVKNRTKDNWRRLRVRRSLKAELLDERRALVAYDDKLSWYSNLASDSAQDIQWQGKPIIVKQFERISNDDRFLVLTFTNQFLKLELKENQWNLTTLIDSNQFDIHTFCIGDSNTCFLAGDDGVYRFDESLKSLSPLADWGGMSLGEIYALAKIENTLWIGSNLGLFQKNLSNSYPPSVHSLIQIKRITVNNQPHPIDSSDLHLAYDQNNLSFAFAALSFKANRKQKLEYRLWGAHAGWKSISPNQNVEFSSLSPGDYQLQVRVVNSSLLDSPVWKKNLVIQVPFWSTWWFVSGLILLSMAMTAILVSYILNRRKQSVLKELEQEKLKQSVTDLKLEAIKSQMNPHFIFNALNSIQDYILQNEKELANLYLGKFADLVRNTLEMSQEKEITLARELENLSVYIQLEALRFEPAFDYELVVDKDIDQNATFLPPLFLQPYVENAIKHGLFHKKGSKQLQIIVEKIQNGIDIHIVDNGIGHARSEEIKKRDGRSHKPFATMANSKRVDLVNKNTSSSYHILTQIGPNNEGTEVIITIKKNH